MDKTNIAFINCKTQVVFSAPIWLKIKLQEEAQRRRTTVSKVILEALLREFPEEQGIVV